MEFDLTVQDIIKRENIGKYYVDEEDILYCLLEDQMGFLEFFVVKDNYKPDNEYELLSNLYNLKEILEMEFKEIKVC